MSRPNNKKFRAARISSYLATSSLPSRPDGVFFIAQAVRFISKRSYQRFPSEMTPMALERDRIAFSAFLHPAAKNGKLGLRGAADPSTPYSLRAAAIDREVWGAS